MLSSFYNHYKRGLFIAANSFSFLFQQPLLLCYHIVIFTTNTAASIIIYNAATYQNCTIPFSIGFHHLSYNFIIELCHQSFLLLFGYIACLYITLFIRFYSDVALIQQIAHVHKHTSISIKTALQFAQQNISTIAIWSAISTLITITTQQWTVLTTPLLIQPQQTQYELFYIIIRAFMTLLPSLLWSASTFFFVPIITLQKQSLVQALKSSIMYITMHFSMTCGGLSWIALIYTLITLSLSYVAQLNLSSLMATIIISSIINIGLSTVLVIYKTKLFLLSQDK